MGTLCSSQHFLFVKMARFAMSLVSVVSADALVGHWKGSVPLIIDVEATFDGSDQAHVEVDVKVAKTHIDCPAEKIIESDTEIIFPETSQVGDCLGDGVREDSKDPSKYILEKNSDGSLTFKSDGYPPLKMKLQDSVSV